MGDTDKPRTLWFTCDLNLSNLRVVIVWRRKPTREERINAARGDQNYAHYVWRLCWIGFAAATGWQMHVGDVFALELPE